MTHQNNVSHHFDADFSPWHEGPWLKTRARASRIWDSERNFSAALSKGGWKKNSVIPPGSLKVLCSFSEGNKTSGSTVSDKKGVKLSL